MSRKEINKKTDNDNIKNVIENTFSHIKDIVDANTVVGKIIELGDKNYIVPVSKISVGLISGGGTIPKGKNENLNVGSGTGFNIVPIGFVAISKSEFKFLPVNTSGDFNKSMLDMCFKFFEKYLKNDIEENDDEKK